VNARGFFRRFGFGLNIALVLMLLISVLARTAFGSLHSVPEVVFLLVLVGWASLPYAIMIAAHARLRRFHPAILLFGSVLIAVFGSYFLLDAFWLNFAPTTSGLPLAFMPLYQLPVCVVALLVARFWDRSRTKSY
jgi:hypothetical protein